jgi:hypothetical protein
VENTPDPLTRLWRARRRHDSIDVGLRSNGTAWELVFARNDRVFLTWPFTDPESARRAADVRLRELQRAGWTVHW